jgi:hypothetical protein
LACISGIAHGVPIALHINFFIAEMMLLTNRLLMIGVNLAKELRGCYLHETLQKEEAGRMSCMDFGWCTPNQGPGNGDNGETYTVIRG